MVDGCPDSCPEFQVLTHRSMQRVAFAWLHELEYLAVAQGGVLEWYTRMLWLGSLPLVAGGR
eukprot:2905782-Lingulodinium_polyedra.AAC.1